MKKISLLILMLTFLLIPTCVNANAVSWEDFVGEINSTLGGEFDFEQVLTDSGQSTAFKNAFNTCYGFSVLGDYGSDSSSNIYEPTKFYFLFNTGNNYDYVKVTSSATSYAFTSQNGTTIFIYTFSTNQITKNSSTNGTNLFSYNLSRFSQFTGDNWQTETTATYFCDKCYLKPLSWNYNFKVYKGSNVFLDLPMDGMNDSDYPWEDGNASGSGSGDTYYNYDFGEYFQKPWISIDNVQGLVQSTSTIPFKIMSQSGDEYYPFDKLKLDLRVYKIYTDENGNKTQSLFDTYKRYNGDYVDTSGYNSVTQNGKINVYNYDLRDKFDSNFIDTYLNSNSGDVGSGNVFDYAFQLVLYSFWEDELSSTKLFYFYENNNLNSGTIPDNYYDNNWNGNSDFNFDNLSFGNILDTAKNFLSSIFSFFEVFPDWLIYLLTFGIAVAIALRILGR